MVLGADREELLGGFGRVVVDRAVVAGIDPCAQRVIGALEVGGPLHLPVARERRGAVHRAVQRIQLVRDLVGDHAEAVARRRDVGAHVGPGQDDRAVLPRLADQVVVPFVQHAMRVLVAALHAERVRVDQQFAPAVQALAPELEQRQAAQHREAQALHLVQAQPVQRGDRLAGEEGGDQRLQALVARGVQRAQPGQAGGGLAPERRIEVGRSVAPPERPDHRGCGRAGVVPASLSGTSRAGSCASAARQDACRWRAAQRPASPSGSCARRSPPPDRPPDPRPGRRRWPSRFPHPGSCRRHRPTGGVHPWRRRRRWRTAARCRPGPGGSGGRTATCGSPERRTGMLWRHDPNTDYSVDAA